MTKHINWQAGRWVVIGMACVMVFLPAASSSQTAVGGQPAPRTIGTTVLPPPRTQAPLPVPDSVVRQSEEQARGQFPEMSRGEVGGQIQEAWNKAGTEAGVFRTDICEGCSYKVRLRERMVTVIELPEGETIGTFDNGDTELFEVKQRGERRLAVKPNGFGVDTNLLIYGKSGAVYPMYLRAERFNSKNVPDLVVKLEGFVRQPSAQTLPDNPMSGADVSAIGAPGASAAKSVPGSLMAMAEASKAAGGSGSPASGTGDFVQKAPFNADKLRGWGQYRLWGNGEAMKPETVFRDDYFTYVRFGEKWKSLELPTAYVVVDGVDELVNTRVEGTTFIIESTQKLISLKSGQSYLCIEYKGQ